MIWRSGSPKCAPEQRDLDIETLVRPGGLVPVDIETTAALVRQIDRFRQALEQIDAIAVSKKAGAIVKMQRIARQALSLSRPKLGGAA